MGNKIIGLAVGLLMAAILIPLGIGAIVATDTTDWTGDFAMLATVWPYLGIFAVLAVALLFIGVVQSGKSKS